MSDEFIQATSFVKKVLLSKHSIWWSSSPKVLGKLVGSLVEALAPGLKYFQIKWKIVYRIKKTIHDGVVS